MNPYALCCYILLLFPPFLCAQNYKDTIFTTQADTIVCQISLVNNYNIFYEVVKKKKRVESTFIARTEVASFSLQSAGVAVQEEETIPLEEDIVDINMTEANGIFYHAFVETPPIFRNGEMDFLVYMQDHVKMRMNDSRTFGYNFVTILYEVIISDTGALLDVSVAQSCSHTGGFSSDSRFMEDQIKRVLSEMPHWTPAKIVGQSVPIKIFIPIKFRIEQFAVIMYSGKHSFSFTHKKY